MSAASILDRIYSQVCVWIATSLIASCAVLDGHPVQAETAATTAVQPPSPLLFAIQQIDLGGITWFVRCDHECAHRTPKTLGTGNSALAPAVALSIPKADPESRPPIVTAMATADARPTPLHMAVLFERDASLLSSAQKQRLSSIRPALQGASLIRIEGRTDQQGPQAANDRTADARALAVMLFVRDQVLQPGGRQPELRASGKGRCCYAATNTTGHGRAANRRAELTVEPFAAEQSARSDSEGITR